MTQRLLRTNKKRKYMCEFACNDLPVLTNNNLGIQLWLMKYYIQNDFKIATSKPKINILQYK